MGELQKREDEMRSSFIKKVKNKEAELKQEEQEVRHDFSFLTTLSYLPVVTVYKCSLYSCILFNK